MTTFLVLKTLHVLAASLYAGASFVNGFQEIRAERSGDPGLRLAALRFAAALGGTASLAIVLMFVWMVGRGLPG